MDEHQEWVISEVPFTSKSRYIGPLIVRVRAACNGVATRWYVLPIVQQINVVFGEVRRRLSDIAEWIVGVDRDQAALARDLAASQLRIARIEERVSLLEEMLEKSSKPDDDLRAT